MRQVELARNLIMVAMIAHIVALLAFASAANVLSDEAGPDAAADCTRWCGLDARLMLLSAVWAAIPLLLWYPWFVMGDLLHRPEVGRPMAFVQLMGALPFMVLNIYAWAREGRWDSWSWQWVAGIGVSLLDMAAAVALLTAGAGAYRGLRRGPGAPT